MHKFVLVAIIFTVFILAVPASTVLGNISVGVKPGDWIQYNVHVTGNPTGDHDIKSASMNVTGVQGTNISIDILSIFNNGTLYPEHITLTLAAGVFRDGFFVPKNLNVGDKIYDANQGNITVSAIEQSYVAGAMRTIVLGANNYTSYSWDRQTGVLVAANSKEPNYTMVTTTNATNIWPADISGLPPSVFYATITAAGLVAAALAVAAANWIRQKKQRPLLLAVEGVGAVFVGVFLAAYLGGMFMNPSTTVLHSEPPFKITLFILGAALLVLIAGNLTFALREKHWPKPPSLKIGLLVVAAAYFLFTLHAMLTLQWIGEWNINGQFSFYIFATDISAGVGLVFRFVASLLAFAAVIYYFNKAPPVQKTYKILRWVLVLEALYWLGLITTAVLNVQDSLGVTGGMSALINSWLLNTVPSVVEAVLIPAALLIFAYQLSPSKPLNRQINWTLITGTSYILVFWLTNTSMWFVTIYYQTGWSYLTTHPENMFNFIVTTVGLLALAIYSASITIKSSKIQTLTELKLKSVAAIIVALGLFFLWNYLTWIFWGGNPLWSEWFAWFLGHNLDLWMLALPLVGLPLLFTMQAKQKHPINQR